VIDSRPMLDLTYEEDSRADVDMNVVMTGDGRFVEIQGTAEKTPFSRAELDLLLALARTGIDEINERQREALAPFTLPAFGPKRVPVATKSAATAAPASPEAGTRA